ncbi:MAG: methylenetetrahydrofolate reductase [NAD(P)H] [Deltaproteobacteria bacterium]|nr:methylenetetrahydrofolate reductase [NAD(P)H] [Deltaproteobacteria bacterium]MBN2845895.1 methylenetetrahydrofolate reductase [NAD(P)H] [Deltaproteobacteria bacterium]
MKIRELLKDDFPTLSFEFFPPKREGNIDSLYLAINELITLTPSFVSVTYGAGGTTRDKTVEIASKIKNDFGQEVLAHLTCVQSTQDDIAEILGDLKEHNIENILALRGDPPGDDKVFMKVEGGFGYANELVEFIRSHDQFSIGVAGYPEGHIEAPNLDTDIVNLKRKVNAGADFIITQICFENDSIYHFRDRARSLGIEAPIIAGIFPIFNFKQIQKMTTLCGATIPSNLERSLSRVSEKNEEIEKYGIEYAIRQSEDLLKNGISGLHFYSMNKSSHVIKIVEELSIPKGG